MPGVEPVNEDAIHGSVLIEKSIVAEKISVDDLVAFGATIGGFEITNSSIQSFGKTSVDNTVRGVYMDRDGQVAFGDAYNFLRYYKAADGTYKLEVKANSFVIGASNKTVEDYVNDEITTQISDRVDNIRIGAVNLIRDSEDLIRENYYFTGNFIVTHDGNGNVMVISGVTVTYDQDGNVYMKSTTTTTHDGAGNVTTR